MKTIAPAMTMIAKMLATSLPRGGGQGQFIGARRRARRPPVDAAGSSRAGSQRVPPLQSGQPDAYGDGCNHVVVVDKQNLPALRNKDPVCSFTGIAP